MKYTTLKPRERAALVDRRELSRKVPTERSNPNVHSYEDDYSYWDYGPLVPDLTCYESELQPSGLVDHNGAVLFRIRPRIGFL